MAIQQLSSQMWGGLGPLPQQQQSQPAAWQTGGKMPGYGGGAQQPVQQNQAGDLTNWMQSLYPEAPTTPQPLEGGFGSGAWDILDPFGIGGAGTGGAGTPAPSQITTGITQPQAPAPPTLPQMGAGPQGLPGANPGMAANWDQAMQPQFMQMLAQYYPQAAGLQGNFEQARAQAGLGWGGQQMAQQSSLLQALQGLV